MSTLLAASLLSLSFLTAASAPQDPVVPPEGMPPDRGEVVTTDSGLKYSVLEPSDGPRPQAGQMVRVHYSGWLTDGSPFDSSRGRGDPFQFKLGSGGVIKGWDEGVALMEKGARYRFTIPPELGYGERGSPPVIPASATLVFDVELLDFFSVPVFRPGDPAAQTTLPSGLVVEVLEPGAGEAVVAGRLCEIEYALFNTSGKLIDASVLQNRNIRETCGQSRFAFMNEAMPLMKPGTRLRLEVPAQMCFGPRPMGPDLPGNSVTVWEIRLAAMIEPLPLPDFKPLDPATRVTTPSGLSYQVLQPGTGAAPAMGQNVTVHYAGWLTDGTLFDASYKRAEPATFRLGQVISGWNEGLQLMKEGGVYRFEIPAGLGYGKNGSPPAIPGDATLIFQVELIRVGD